VRIEAGDNSIVDTYLHQQAAAGSTRWPSSSRAAPRARHDLAVHIAFARPSYLHRDDVPADEVAAEREGTIEGHIEERGQAEAALPKIVRGVA